MMHQIDGSSSPGRSADIRSKAARGGFNMATLYHEVWIKAPTAKVFWAISTADGISAWWDKQTATPTPQGIVLEHNPGPEHGAVKMKVLDLTQNKRVEWECIS